MALGRPVQPINLIKDVKTELQSVARSRSLPHGLVRRAKIILMAAQGLNNKSIAQKVDVSTAAVGMWRKRFVQQGIMAWASMTDRNRADHELSATSRLLS